MPSPFGWRASLPLIPNAWCETRLVSTLAISSGRAVRFPLNSTSRIVAVGAGKAGAGMAAGLEEAFAGTPAAERLSGWINVPADCVRQVAAHYSSRGPTRGAQRADRGGRCRFSRNPAARWPTRGARRLHRASFRRRQRTFACTDCRHHFSRQANRDAVPDVRRCDDQRTQLRSQAPFRHQRGQSRAGRSRHAADFADYLGCDRRSARCDRLGTDGGRSYDGRRCAGRSHRNSRPTASRIPQAVWSALEAKSRGPAEAPFLRTSSTLSSATIERALAAAADTKPTGWDTRVQSLGSDQHGIARDVGRRIG